MTKRTQEEILKRIADIEKDDLFGFQTGDLIKFLTFENAKPHLVDGANKDDWVQVTDPVKCIKDYMEFAWDKANNCRGLSAGRSVEHMKAWLWLDGKDELVEKMDSLYRYYGKPCLHAVCVEYGIDWEKLDDNRWVNNEDEDGLTAKEALE
jgi:hypothetical protein